MSDYSDASSFSDLLDSRIDPNTSYAGSNTFSGSTPDELVAELEESTRTTYDDTDLSSYLDLAVASGIDTPLTSTLTKVWNFAKDGIKEVNDFSKGNPGLTSMLTSGISNGMKDKAASELADKKRTWSLEDAARKKADEKELWDRKNQSIIDMKPANLGLIGSNMYDSHIAYLQSRKK